MKGNYTLTMIKPDAVSANRSGRILNMINDAGFRIVSLKMLKMSKEQASIFYLIHKERPFYNDLVEYMSSGPVIAAILEKPDAVEAYRMLMGATNPAIAEEGTIRRLYGESIQRNAVHGSDSDENAVAESNFFFDVNERY
jgi:nucleoside-diphosphate kinase